jgi:hypothetical protein
MRVILPRFVFDAIVAVSKTVHSLSAESEANYTFSINGVDLARDFGIVNML